MVMDSGRKISPEWLETELLQQREISDCLVYTPDNRTVQVLLVPTDYSVTDKDLAAAIARTNYRLPEYARIDMWHRSQAFASVQGWINSSGKKARNTILESLNSQTVGQSNPAPRKPLYHNEEIQP